MKRGKKKAVLIVSLIILALFLLALFFIKLRITGHEIVIHESQLNILKILGQPNLNETMYNLITANRAFHIVGVHVDTSKNPNRVYVIDYGNNRIIGFNGTGYCNIGRNDCTLDSDCPKDEQCINNPEKNANIVIGQSNFETGSCNGDNTHFNKPSASTLCFTGSGLITLSEASISNSLATDSLGNLYVADIINNRVLKFNDPFSNDSIADQVWGQDNFSESRCNKGHDPDANYPNSETLCFSGYDYNTDHNGPGVEIDYQGNLWVSDTINSRVLRFPNQLGIISKTADTILGITGSNNFNISGRCKYGNPWDTPDNFCWPGSLKVNSSGSVYIIDQYSGNPFTTNVANLSRILIFNPNSTGYQNIASSELKKQPLAPLFEGFGRPTGLAFDLNESNIWVSDYSFSRAVLVNPSGEFTKVIGQPNLTEIGPTDYGGQIKDIPILRSVFGGIGTDIAGNLYLGSNFQYTAQVTRFYSNFSDSGWHFPNAALLSYGWNNLSAKTFSDSRGIAVVDNQLIVSDTLNGRIMVFDNYLSKNNFPEADYIINGIAGRMSIDKEKKLWVAFGNSILIFQTPITSNNPTPLRTIRSGYFRWADDLSPAYFYTLSVAYDNSTDVLWILDTNRIFKVSNFSGDALVDLVIGQEDKVSACCNMPCDCANESCRLPPYVDNSTLCAASFISLDNFGNLYVVDGTYERSGNTRVLEFDKSTLNSQGNIFFLPGASRVFAKPNLTSSFYFCNGPCNPISISFDSQNRMILSSDSYGNEQYNRIWVYSNPLANQTPDFAIPLAFGQAGDSGFNEQGNLIIQDHTWNRILVLDDPFLYYPLDTDNDSIPNFLDKCPLRYSLTADGCPPPQNYSKFKNNLSTNIENLSQYNNISLTLGIENKGIIKFKENVSIAGIDFDKDVKIERTYVEINTSSSPELNVSAEITLINISGINNPLILKDGLLCQECSIISYEQGTFVFNISHFTRYEVIGCGDSICDSSESCSSCSEDCGSCQENNIMFCNITLAKSSNWRRNITLPKFDSSKGDLLGVTFQLNTTIEENFSIENLENNFINVTFKIEAYTSYNLGSTWHNLTLFAQKDEPNISPFDNIIDFAGPSGRKYTLIAINSTSFSDLEISNYLASGFFELPIYFSLNAKIIGGASTLQGYAINKEEISLCVSYTYIPSNNNAGGNNNVGGAGGGSGGAGTQSTTTNRTSQTPSNTQPTAEQDENKTAFDIIKEIPETIKENPDYLLIGIIILAVILIVILAIVSIRKKKSKH